VSVFPHSIPKNDAARIAKLDAQLLHDMSWKYIYFGGQGHKSQKQWVFALLWVLASSGYIVTLSAWPKWSVTYCVCLCT